MSDDELKICQEVRDDWHKQADELLVRVQNLEKRAKQLLDDLHVIRLMMDPENRFPGESNVWIAGWLRSHNRIQPPKRTKKGWE